MCGWSASKSRPVVFNIAWMDNMRFSLKHLLPPHYYVLLGVAIAMMNLKQWVLRFAFWADAAIDGLLLTVHPIKAKHLLECGCDRCKQQQDEFSTCDCSGCQEARRILGMTKPDTDADTMPEQPCQCGSCGPPTAQPLSLSEVGKEWERLVQNRVWATLLRITFPEHACAWTDEQWFEASVQVEKLLLGLCNTMPAVNVHRSAETFHVGYAGLPCREWTIVVHFDDGAVNSEASTLAIAAAVEKLTASGWSIHGLRPSLELARIDRGWLPDHEAVRRANGPDWDGWVPDECRRERISDEQQAYCSRELQEWFTVASLFRSHDGDPSAEVVQGWLDDKAMSVELLAKIVDHIVDDRPAFCEANMQWFVDRCLALLRSRPTPLAQLLLLGGIRTFGDDPSWSKIAIEGLTPSARAFHERRNRLFPVNDETEAVADQEPDLNASTPVEKFVASELMDWARVKALFSLHKGDITPDRVTEWLADESMTIELRAKIVQRMVDDALQWPEGAEWLVNRCLWLIERQPSTHAQMQLLDAVMAYVSPDSGKFAYALEQLSEKARYWWLSIYYPLQKMGASSDDDGPWGPYDD